MAFAGPPEDDIDWADVSPAGSAKFLARAWRVANDVTSEPGVAFGSGDVALRRATHHLLADAPGLVESFKFNVLVARLMEHVNVMRKAIDSGVGGADPAVREAAEVLAILLSLFSPYTAEDMWATLGHEPTVALQTLPNGRDLVVAVNKGGVAVALDPDRNGALVWRSELSEQPPKFGPAEVMFGVVAEGAPPLA